MGAEDHIRLCRHFGYRVYKDNPFLLKALHNMVVMDDLVKHIEWRTVLFERAFDGLDGHFDTGAKAAWLGEKHFFDAHNIISESGGIVLDCQLAERPGQSD